MTREDLYVIPNLPKIAAVVVLGGLVGLAGLGVSTVFATMLLVMIYVGWDGRTRLSYRWQDSAIASWVTSVLAVVILSLLETSAQLAALLPDRVPSPIKQHGILAVIFGELVIIALPAIFALIGHAAAKYLAPNAAPKKTEVPVKGRQKK